MDMYRKIKYPCGLELEEKIFDNILINIGRRTNYSFSTNINLCPVHGSECKKEV